MKQFIELLNTETYWTSKIQNDLFNHVEAYMREHQLTRTKFAAQLGVSKGYLTQVLNGDFDHKISKLVQLSLAIGKAPVFELEDLKEVINKEADSDFLRIQSKYVKKAPLLVKVPNQQSLNTANKLPCGSLFISNITKDRNLSEKKSSMTIAYNEAV